MVPNLRHLKIINSDYLNSLGSIDQLFDRDVLYSLMKFTFEGFVAKPDIVCNAISMLSDQCSYLLNVEWCVYTDMSVLDTNNIFIDIFEQMKGRIPIEIKLNLYDNNYIVTVLTVPETNTLCIYNYEWQNSVRAYVQVSLCFTYEKRYF